MAATEVLRRLLSPNPDANPIAGPNRDPNPNRNPKVLERLGRIEEELEPEAANPIEAARGTFTSETMLFTDGEPLEDGEADDSGVVLLRTPSPTTERRWVSSK